MFSLHNFDREEENLDELLKRCPNDVPRQIRNIFGIMRADAQIREFNKFTNPSSNTAESLASSAFSTSQSSSSQSFNLQLNEQKSEDSDSERERAKTTKRKKKRRCCHDCVQLSTTFRSYGNSLFS
jgi:hypothetical protein